MPRKRPLGVTLLTWLVLTMMTWGAVRFFAALRGWEVLVEFKSTLSPLYLAGTGAGWAVVGGVLLWSLLFRQAWSLRAILFACILWLLEYWLERIFFQHPRANLPFALAGTLLILIITLVITQHKSTKDFFSRSEAYEQQNQNSGTQ